VKALIQRVDHGEVSIRGESVGSITTGLVVFLGIEEGDERADADYLFNKISRLRIFEDTEGKMNHSLLDIGGGMLVVSQFTLLADCGKGRRPSFTRALEPAKAKVLYEYFVAAARKEIIPVATGVFQAHMRIALVNNGPVTIFLDSRNTGRGRG